MMHCQFQVDYGSFQLALDLKLPNRGVTVLFGDSGSGKTSLLRCIAGLQTPQYGHLQIHGKLWQDSDKGVFLPAHQRPLGYVFQQANLFPHLTVAENIQFGIKRLDKSVAKANLGELIDLLGIENLLKRLPDKLSGGEQQRVAIARALALNPEILLMDEPLAALDFKRKQEILPYLQNLQQRLEIPVLYVTHSLQEMLQLADHIVLMNQGKVEAFGSLSQVLSRIDLPLAKQREACSVWQTELSAHDADFQLSEVKFNGGSLSLPHLDAAIGSAVRVQIYARDVSVCLEKPQASSILNILPAKIEQISEADGGQTVVQLRVGDQTLLAHITSKSKQLLGLNQGMAVYVQIKGSSVLNNSKPVN